ncbi:hypothetical protein JGUZn3_04760 [Entomobacter blattae]|uniref:Uncharacterized protein n=1 Tax=Entomobacter blattae TaxID=2762277 RepID=A0A7H1NPL5_9PROT|nr:hypothetical protein JGUZn3_04760 [Entomobacter blattae]
MQKRSFAKRHRQETVWGGHPLHTEKFLIWGEQTDVSEKMLTGITQAIAPLFSSESKFSGSLI